MFNKLITYQLWPASMLLRFNFCYICMHTNNNSFKPKKIFMKLKTLLLVLLVATGSSLFAQVKVDVFINGTLAGQYEIKKDQTEGGGLAYKKKDYRSVDKLSVQLKGRAVGGGYFQKVEVTDADGSVVSTAEETKGVKGQFVLSDKAVVRKLKNGKPLTLYLIKTPANTKSTEEPKRIYIGTLSRS